MSVNVGTMTIPGAPLEGCNPLPFFHDKTPLQKKSYPNLPEEMHEDLGVRSRVLPYRMQDRYSRKRVPVALKTVVLENEFLKAVFLPENGARLYSLFDKKQNRELLMCNPVYQPGNLAIRNAWLSGGIEWNFGWRGHSVFTCDHLFTAVLQDEAGNDFVRFYEFERAKNNLFQMDFHLPEGSPILYSHVKLFNPNEQDSTTYWWTNIAVAEDGNTRILSSSDEVIVAVGSSLSLEKMPYLTSFEGEELSYPHNAGRSYDHFYQVPDDTRTAWEAAANRDGMVFFDRSTAPLLYHKMFCWGNHAAGKRWQDLLSDPDKGDYIEIQAGLARSQMHDKLFPANSTIEWTQCFGGMALDCQQLHQESLQGAMSYLDRHIDAAVSEEALLELNGRFSALAEKNVSEEDLVHMGSGWGALEETRRKLCGQPGFPGSMCFPKATIGREQAPWEALLVTGKLPEEEPGNVPASWMVSAQWMRLLEESIREKGEDWYSLLHYGVMLYEQMDGSHTAYEASHWPEYPRYTELARKAFIRSVELNPSVWALYGLFCIEKDAGNDDLAERYFDRIFTLQDAYVDFAFPAEYLLYLCKKKKYQKAWDLYRSLPEQLQQNERIVLCASKAAIKLRNMKFVEAVFKREFAVIREGENTLTEVWFEYCAWKLAEERGLGDDVSVEVLSELAQEAWDICPPPRAIDFRMSYDRRFRYRMEE